MSIEKIAKKINQFRLFLVLFIVVAVGLTSFLLGRISAQTSQLAAVGASQQGSRVAITYPDNYEELIVTPTTTKENALFMASKNGTKYYPLNCASGNRISEPNRVFFASEDEAKLTGFERTQQCKF